MSRFDALVVGAGPAGATAALLLARRGASVAIVEKAAFPRRKVCGEFISATTWPLLRNLGIEDRLEGRIGPPVRRVGLFARDAVISSPMPAPQAGGNAWGHAVEREHLDAALLESAARSGVRIWQPFSLEQLEGDAGNYRATVSDGDGRTSSIAAKLVIAAHGSWERGAMPTQPSRSPQRASDLLGFKAHFNESRLPQGLMPLVLFPGGYGGMVHTGESRVSFSCCIRRDVLAACRKVHAGLGAGEAVIAHVTQSCRGVREALAGAARDGPWLSAGPIHPGIRPRARDGIFVVGNAAGEAHPLVAEGISMAIQSAWLLCERLAAAGDLSRAEALAAAGREYSRAWRRQFAGRVFASSAFAALTVSPWSAGASAAVLQKAPAILTLGARWSGKARLLHGFAP
jgi:flavin-dependent dehydrogenase